VMLAKHANATVCKHTFLKWSRSGTLTKTKTPQRNILLIQSRLSGGKPKSVAAGSRA